MTKARTKLVDGVRRKMSPDEVKRVEADAARDAKRQASYDADPKNFPLEPWQFHAMVDILEMRGVLSRADIDAAVAQLPTVDQIAAKNKIAHSKRFDFDDPLFTRLTKAVGLKEKDFRAAWLEAKDLS